MQIVAERVATFPELWASLRGVVESARPRPSPQKVPRKLCERMSDPISVKGIIVSKSGPQWEQQLLSSHKQQVLVSIDGSAQVSSLKDKLLDKFLSANLSTLNGDPAYLKSIGVERITGAKITTLLTKDGYDVDEDSTVRHIFRSVPGSIMELQAEIDLIATMTKPACEVCGIAIC